MYIDQGKILRMFENMCQKHKGEMLSAYLDFEIVTVTNPRYPEEKMDVVVPLFVIDFK